ncbi:DUF4873 domain-containing protein [Micromonospora acroterricola]|uniref:DUF4873 domain-containing protein n=1 Tax=Micromonospora acroterricola TaxID=2202421 RepID=A0A317D2X9_9ACTN|nr:DUF4873 domain-containing protein [Micromonospora acroterricola]PWR08206.1 DUF4873 domain-containing protein [Micromonospora acroterricola]
MTYHGPAEVAGTSVRVHLAGRWEPVDGRYHWGGRIEPDARVAGLVRSGRRDVELRIAGRARPARLAEVDPWGGVGVTGVGAPPWPEPRSFGTSSAGG